MRRPDPRIVTFRWDDDDDEGGNVSHVARHHVSPQECEEVRINRTASAEPSGSDEEKLNEYLRETIDDPQAWEDATPDYSTPAAISLRLPTPLLARVRRLADERGVGYTSLMRQWIEQRVAVEERDSHRDPGMPLISPVASIEDLASSIVLFRDVLQRSADEFQTRADLALTELSAAPTNEGRRKATTDEVRERTAETRKARKARGRRTPVPE